MSLLLTKVVKINIYLGFEKMDFKKKLQIKQANKVNPICHSMIGRLLSWGKGRGGAAYSACCIKRAPDVVIC